MLKKLRFDKNILFAVALVVYSTLLVNQGLTWTDTGYNYGNFEQFDSLDGMWKFSTYLATAIGAFFTRLPFGRTMLGMNIYTGLVKASIALIAYFACVKVFRMQEGLTFLAELMALGCCWCPTALLYNYCTYLFFNLGAIILCIAVKKEKKSLYILAGIFLGINVLVRLPNLAEAALIVPLWFYCVIRKVRWRETVRKTVLCLAGYLLGAGGVLACIFAKYGAAAYISGIREILAMPSENGGYSLKEMLRGDLYEYRTNLPYLLAALGLAAAGTAVYFLFAKIFPNLKKSILRTLYILCNFCLLASYYRAGMFRFTYYCYDAIQIVGILFLMLAGLMGLWVMFFARENYSLRMHAATMGVVILITPLGSNNYLFTAVNNLFWVAPFVMYVCYLGVKKLRTGREEAAKAATADMGEARTIRLVDRISGEPLLITLLVLVCFVWVQAVLFGGTFVFRDGIYGEKRTARITEIPALKGMYTTPENAAALNGLYLYLREEGLLDREVILYQDVPSVAYYMGMKPALSTTWPDLGSFSTEKFRQELDRVKKRRPILILGVSLNRDSAKWEYLSDFADELEYELVYSNEKCYVYR